MNYSDLKLLKKQIKIPVKDLIALAPNNDPFYLPPARQEGGTWFKTVWQGGEFRRVHIRRVHYWLVSQKEPFIMRDGKPYQNTEACWKILCESTKSARYMDLVPIDAFVDKRNPPAIEYENDEFIIFDNRFSREVGAGWIHIDTFEISDMPSLPYIRIEKPYGQQRYQIEIWCEKSTMNDVLEPICRRHECNLITGLGELSITAVDLLFDRIKQSGKATRIFYISDFDPAGKSMPVAVSRKAEFMAQEHDVDLVIDSLMLTEEQCIEFDLPRTPIKDSEMRKSKFEANHGAGATELDALEALHPGELEKLVTHAVLQYRDPDLQKRIGQIYRDGQEQASKDQRHARGKYADEIAEAKSDWEKVFTTSAELMNEWKKQYQPLWEQMANEMDGEFNHACPKAEYAETPGDVLFDSNRTYLQQMDAYRNFQKKEPLNLAGMEVLRD